MIAFNVSPDWIAQRVVEPWERGEEIVLKGQHWNPRQVRIQIYEGSDVTTSPTLKAWNAMTRESTECTDRFITRPAGTAAPIPTPELAADRRAVMVVHGRNAEARAAMFAFLRALDLRPLEWSELVGAANAGAPYIGEVLDEAFSRAQAAVVLSTPDDFAYLRPDLVPADDPEGESLLRGQARPNVFFEAGMAMGRFPRRTVLTELGTLRPASDLTGRHAVRLRPGPECRKELAQRLEGAGCDVNTDGTDWLSVGEFVAPTAIDEGKGYADGGSRSQELERRVDALLADLAGQRGFVLWRVAELYNGLMSESGLKLPRAERREPTGAEALTSAPLRSRMTAEEMRALLGQLRAQL